MSQENVEVVRKAFEASKRRDDDEVFPLYDPEVEIESGYDGRVYRGLDSVRAFFRDWLEVWDEIDWEAEEWIDAGEHVITLLHVSGRGKLSGVPVERSEAHLWTLREGKLRRLRVFETKDEALEAAGLRERAMSQENLEIVREHLDAYLHYDAPRSLSFVDPHVVVDRSRIGTVDSDVVYGHEALVKAVRRQVGAFEEYAFVVERLTDLGSGAILAVATESGRGKGSGIAVRRSFAALYTVIDGKIVRITQFPSEEQALEAAGLSE